MQALLRYPAASSDRMRCVHPAIEVSPLALAFGWKRNGCKRGLTPIDLEESTMPKAVQRKPQRFTVDEMFEPETDLPEKMELHSGVIGPFSDKAVVALLANWGADRVVRLTGPDIWREAIAARERG